MTIILLGKPFSLVVLLLLLSFQNTFQKIVPPYLCGKKGFSETITRKPFICGSSFFFFFSLLSISISSKIKAYSYIGGWTFYLFFLHFKWPLFLFVLEHCFFGTRSKNSICFFFLEFSNCVFWKHSRKYFLIN